MALIFTNKCSAFSITAGMIADVVVEAKRMDCKEVSIDRAIMQAL